MADWNYVSQNSVLTRGRQSNLFPAWNPRKNAFEFGSGHKKPFDFHWWMKMPVGHLREQLPAGTILDRLKTRLVFNNREFYCNCQELTDDILMLNAQLPVQCSPEFFKELLNHFTSKFQFVTSEGLAAYEMDIFWSSYARSKIEDGKFELSIQYLKDIINNGGGHGPVEVLTSIQNLTGTSSSSSPSDESSSLAGIRPGNYIWTMYKSMNDFPMTIIRP